MNTNKVEKKIRKGIRKKSKKQKVNKGSIKKLLFKKDLNLETIKKALNIKEKINKEKFFYEKGIYLENGINIIEALSLDGKVYEEEIKKDILKGVSLGESLKNHNLIEESEEALITLSEETGNLDLAFKDIYKSFKEKRELNNTVKTILIYPMILLLFSFVFIFASVYFIIPSLYDMLVSLNAENNLLRKIMEFKTIVKAPYALAFLGLLFALIVKTLLDEKRVFKIILGRKKPLFDELLFIEEFQKLIDSGMDIYRALKVTRDANINPYDLQKHIEKGLTLSESFKKSNFSNILLSYIKMAEETGDLAFFLKSYVNLQKTYFKELLKKKSQLLEPVSIIIMGGVVLCISIIILMPMLSAYEGL